jgi:hypothetical protein
MCLHDPGIVPFFDGKMTTYDIQEKGMNEQKMQEKRTRE